MNVRTSETPTVRGRHIHNLMADIAILHPFLSDETISDIYINPDGKLWVRRPLQGRVFTGTTVPPDVTKRIILSTASLLEKTVNDDYPVLEGVIPEYGSRIHAFLDPWVLGPSLCIRKPSTKIFTLLEYVQEGRMTKKQNDAIYDALMNRKNIMVGGGTGTGKTTFLNALISELAIHRPDDRLFIVEDTPEIRCMAQDYTSLVVRPTQTVEAVRGALRFNPDRIIFGELRYGDTALELLKAYNTGHSGGFSTIHCNSADMILPRLVSLISEAITGQVQYSFIAEAVNVGVYLHNVPNFGPKVEEVLTVDPTLKNGEFQYKRIRS